MFEMRPRTMLRRSFSPGLALLVGAMQWACAGADLRLSETADELSVGSVQRASSALPIRLIATSLDEPGPLHVYIEGDGSPWVQGRWPSLDPTSEDLLMLRLMALDPSPAVFLGRPCYHGLAEISPCSPWYWTQGRYSEQVVSSLETALRDLVDSSGKGRIWLIGHSGGGTLAMLLAERFQETERVVTLGGNLDPDAWSEKHGYHRLHDSLNPTLRDPLNAAIDQLHLVGSSDEIMPLEIARRAVEHQGGAQLVVVPDCDHRSGWEAVWPSILRETTLQARQGETLPELASLRTDSQP